MYSIYIYIYKSVDYPTDKLVKNQFKSLSWNDWMDGLMGGQMDRKIDVQMDT